MRTSPPALPWLFTSRSSFEIFSTAKIFVCGTLSTCYKFSLAALSLACERTRTRYELRIYLFIIYARLARSRRKSSSVFFGRRKNKAKCFINFGSCHHQSSRRWNVSPSCFPPTPRTLCEKFHMWFLFCLLFKELLENIFYVLVVSMFTFRVLGKYYDRSTWNYHPRSDIKARTDFTICDVSERIKISELKSESFEKCQL